MNPLFSIGIFFVTLGILILLFPHLLQIIVALTLLSIGISLISLDRSRRKGQVAWFNIEKNR
ncbi:MAG: DUF3096 domain-containing protein [Candidatus Altimarinota bacterium]